MNALVTGVGGFVGSRIMDMYPDFTPCPRGFLQSADEEALDALLERISPAVIFHTAAISDIGQCAQDPEGSYRANVLIPLWLARRAKKTGAKLICFSSDQVYSGESSAAPHTEEERLCPANIYGRHKLEMEERVLELLPSAVMLRATWMYDLPGYGLPIKGNLPLNLLTAALRGEECAFSVNELRGVTYVREVVARTVDAAKLPGGVYNFGSDNDRNFYETALAFAETLRLPCKLLPKNDLPPRNLSMDLTKLRANGLNFSSSVEGIRRCVEDFGLQGLMK